MVGGVTMLVGTLFLGAKTYGAGTGHTTRGTLTRWTLDNKETLSARTHRAPVRRNKSSVLWLYLGRPLRAGRFGKSERSLKFVVCGDVLLVNRCVLPTHALQCTCCPSYQHKEWLWDWILKTLHTVLQLLFGDIAISFSGTVQRPFGGIATSFWGQCNSFLGTV